MPLRSTSAMAFEGYRRTILWPAVRVLHAFDYAIWLPLVGRLPLFAGYALSALRGYLNGLVGRDWRSVGLETRHVARQSAQGYRILLPTTSASELRALVRERFATESREEYEGRLIVAGRVEHLRCHRDPRTLEWLHQRQGRGLMLLTPHFDSFMLGIAFLGLTGMKINVMTSAITNDPKVDPAVSRHFFRKYRAMERLMNGGQMLDREPGLRPFYQMLARGECLVILADAPATPGGALVTPHFLGARRKLAGGALRLAQKTDSDLGAFVCHYECPGRYRLDMGPVHRASDPQALDAAYAFLSEKIQAAPGRWWAVDLLPLMPVVNERTAPDTEEDVA